MVAFLEKVIAWLKNLIRGARPSEKRKSMPSGPSTIEKARPGKQAGEEGRTKEEPEKGRPESADKKSEKSRSKQIAKKVDASVEKAKEDQRKGGTETEESEGRPRKRTPESGLEGESEKTEPKKADSQASEESKPSPEKQKRPRVRKSPTEKTEKKRGRRKQEEGKRQATSAGGVEKSRRKQVHLGERERKRSRRKPRRKKRGDRKEKEKKSKRRRDEQKSTRVKAPYVELDLDRQEIRLVLPEQEVRREVIDRQGAEQPNYKVWINGRFQGVEPRISSSSEELSKLEETKLEVPSCLESFKVEFPECLAERQYRYDVHGNTNFYAFRAVGNNLGRLHPTFNREGGLNPLPRTELWLLIREGYEVEPEPYMTEERFFWEEFQPVCVDATARRKLVIREVASGAEREIPCERSFTLDGSETIPDDFIRQSPLFTGDKVKVRAPTKRSAGWAVWIQNKKAGHRIAARQWTGKEPLSLTCPDSLPCRCGEFQVDICKDDARSPTETLFFRFVPGLQLRYPEELVFPDAQQGHEAAVVQIDLDEAECEWKLRCDEKWMRSDGGYQVQLPANKDTLRFAVEETDKPETRVRVQLSVPRLKWRLEGEKEWRGTAVKVNRETMLPGIPFHVFIRTNDRQRAYKMSAVLRTENKVLQKDRLRRTGSSHRLRVNSFFDTAAEHDEPLFIEVSIYADGDEKPLGDANVLEIPGEARRRPKEARNQFKTHPLTSVMAQVLGGQGWRKGKGFSEKEVREAGLNAEDMRRLGMMIDKRRKSAHDQNVKALKRAREEVLEDANRSS